MCFVVSQPSLPNSAKVLCRYTVQRQGELFTGSCREENTTFFLLHQLKSGNGKRNVKKEEHISKSCCRQSREETTEKPAEEVMDGAMVWKGFKSLFAATSIWCILTHKKNHPALVLLADISWQGLLFSERKSFSITVGPVSEWSNCFHPAYLKMRY